MCTRVLTVERVKGVQIEEILRNENLPAKLRKHRRHLNGYAITCCNAGKCQVVTSPDEELLVIERLRNLGLKVETIEVPETVDQITLLPLA